MAKIIPTKLELFVIHFNNRPLHMATNRYGQWKPTKKIYFTQSAAKSGLRFIPEVIRDSCEIVKYVPDNFINSESYGYE